MANPVANIFRGSVVPVPNMRIPDQGAQALPILLDFTNSAALDGNMQSEFDGGEFDFAQSVFIDNSNNSSNLILTLPGIGQRGQAIVAAPYTQGYYPCSPPMGDPRFTAATSLGQQVPIIFYNIPIPYFVWGSNSGGPGIVNLAFAPLILANGNTQLVAGVAGTTTKLWRGMFEVDAPCILKFTDGPGGAVLWTADLSTLGSVTFNLGALPWFLTLTKGADLTVNSSAAVNLYGGMGYQQS